MAKVIYDIYKVTNDQSPVFGRHFGRVVHTETMDTEMLAQHIAEHGSPYTEDIVEGVLRKLATCIPELVSEGHGVKIDGIGTFYPVVKSMGADTVEEFTGANVKQVLMRFTADRNVEEAVSDLRGKVLVETKYVLEKEKVTIDGKEEIIKHYTPVADYIKKHQAPQP
jgi:predicted histone-like DNA-binding protein